MSALARGALALLLVATLALSACGPSEPQFRSADVTGTTYGRDFALTDHHGKAVTLADYRGKAVVLFFGYTHCPDVCPTTLSELAAAMEKLGPAAKDVQVLFVTVDPARDTPALLGRVRAGVQSVVRRALRRRRGARADGEGIPRPVPEAGRPDARELHDGPFGGHLRVRPARAACASTSATGRAPTSSPTTSANCCARRSPDARRASRLAPMSASLTELLTQAIAHERRGDTASARALYERALALSPGHPGALLKLALFAQQAGDLEAARAGLERALAAAKRKRIGTAPVLLAQGELFRAAGERDAARAAYAAALAEAPRLAGARAGLGLIALATGDSAGAARAFDAALALEPANAGLALLLGQVQKGRGRLREADAAFAAATRAAPGSVDVWLARGGFAMEVELAAAAAPQRGGRMRDPRRSRRRGTATAGADVPVNAAAASDRLDVAIDAFARAEALAPSSALVVAQHAMALRYACALARLRRRGGKAGGAGTHAAADPSFAVSPLMAAALLDDPDRQRAAIANWARASLPPRRRSRRHPTADSSPAAATACASVTCRPISTTTRRRT